MMTTMKKDKNDDLIDWEYSYCSPELPPPPPSPALTTKTTTMELNNPDEHHHQQTLVHQLMDQNNNDNTKRFSWLNPMMMFRTRKVSPINNGHHNVQDGDEKMFQMKIIHHSSNNRMNNSCSLLSMVDNNSNDDQQRYLIYQVENMDETLCSIAAQFNATPSHIKALNRLTSNHVFVGQNLLIQMMMDHSNSKTTTTTTT
nr:uncharacterized protein LOC124490748 [Dermatophagoides farinae]